jgi:hypothetical protein
MKPSEHYKALLKWAADITPGRLDYIEVQEKSGVTIHYIEKKQAKMLSVLPKDLNKSKEVLWKKKEEEMDRRREAIARATEGLRKAKEKHEKQELKRLKAKYE